MRTAVNDEMTLFGRHVLLSTLLTYCSMEEIANHAGTSKSVFYRYFEDKKGLQQAVAQASIDFMENELKKAGKAADSAQDGLYTMVLSYLRLADSPLMFITSLPQSLQVWRFSR